MPAATSSANASSFATTTSAVTTTPRTGDQASIDTGASSTTEAPSSSTVTTNPATSEPLPSDPCAVKKVDAGNVHTCALAYSGAVWCWGNNSYAAVGEGAANGAQRTPYHLEALGTDNLDVFTGQDTSCVQKTDGRLLCWGSFGDGDGWDHVKAATEFDAFGHEWQQLALHTAACAVTADNRVACWGFGSQQAEPIDGFGTDVVNLSLSHDTVCAVKADGSVMCGRVGGAAPQTVAGITDAVMVSTGGALESESAPWGRLVASTADGAAFWALGGEQAQRLNPAGAEVNEIYIGETTASEHLFAAGTRSGGVVTWGTNRCGGLGDGLGGGGDTSHDHRDVLAAPAQVARIDDYRQLAVGHEHACVIRANHTLWCWGRNAEGEIGTGANDTTCDSGTASPNQTVPVQIALCPL